MHITINEDEYQELMRVKREYEELKKYLIEHINKSKMFCKEISGGDKNNLVIGACNGHIAMDYQTLEAEFAKLEELLK